MCAGSTVTLTTEFQLDFLLLNMLGTVTGVPFFVDYCLSNSETKQLHFLFSCKPSLNCFFRLEQSLQMQLMMDSGLRDLYLL